MQAQLHLLAEGSGWTSLQMVLEATEDPSFQVSTTIVNASNAVHLLQRHVFKAEKGDSTEGTQQELNITDPQGFKGHTFQEDLSVCQIQVLLFPCLSFPQTPFIVNSVLHLQQELGEKATKKYTVQTQLLANEDVTITVLLQVKVLPSRFPINETISVPTQSQQTWTVSSERNYVLTFKIWRKENVNATMADRFASLTYGCAGNNETRSFAFTGYRQPNFATLFVNKKDFVTVLTLQTQGEAPKVPSFV